MAEYLIQETTLIEIANAIRNKADKTDRIPVSKFADEIGALKAGGNPPVLDDTLPADVSCIVGGNVTCNVLVYGDDIDEYTYQWYVNNVAVIGATESSYIVNGTEIGTMTVYCNVTNVAGTTSSRVATITVKSGIPEYTYSGTSVLTNEGNSDWNIKFTTTGNLNFTELGNAVDGIEVCLVGGGMNGTNGQGGQGGQVVNISTNLNNNTNYSIIIGAAQGQTSAFGHAASPGLGGAGGGWGVNGANGTYAFGDTNYARYGAGGGGGGGIYFNQNTGYYCGNFGYGGDYGGGTGGACYRTGEAAIANTGGGGGGGGDGGGHGAAGGSGVVIIRNKRS